MNFNELHYLLQVDVDGVWIYCFQREIQYDQYQGFSLFFPEMICRENSHFGQFDVILLSFVNGRPHILFKSACSALKSLKYE